MESSYPLPVRVALLELLALLLVLFAALGILAGVLDQGVEDRSYDVAFAHPGDDCGSAEQTFDVANGEPLPCVPAYAAGGSGRVSFPGFSRDQDQAVQTLAQSLGGDGLSDADRRQIRQRVDRIAATVPESKHGRQRWTVEIGPLRGARLAMAGAAVIVAVLLSFLWARIQRRRRQERRRALGRSAS